jgi:cytidylate kinase
VTSNGETATEYDAARGSRLIAIDGPSGTGKSTVARAIARTLGYGYLDTGALYRIVTLHVLRAGIDPTDDAAVAAALPGLVFAPPTDPDGQQHCLSGDDVTTRIREDDVTAAVSAVSANPAVRAYLLGLQRDIAYGAPMVVEGRDIGTVIAPDAAVKIYLTADAKVRASRRAKQNAVVSVNGSASATLEAVQQDLARRDAADSTRTAAPLEAAADAVLVDSTHQSVDDTTNAVLAVAAERGQTPAGSKPVSWFHLSGDDDPVPAGRRPRNVDRGRRIGIALSHLMYRMTVRGEQHMPASGPLVVVANHITFADGPILFGRLPRRISFLVKAEVLVGPLGWLLRTVGQYAIDRSAPQREVLLAALAQLGEGGVIGIFPEGQRTDGSVNEVFRGAGWLAARSGAAVVPVALRGTARPAGRRLKRFRPRVRVLIGPAFRVPRGGGRKAIDVATAEIQARLAGLVADLDRGIAARDDYRRRYGRGWRRA